MTLFRLSFTAVALAAAINLGSLGAVPSQQPPTQTPQQPTDIAITLTGQGGAPQIAVPVFVPLSRDEATLAAARTMSQVLFDDLTFEREFALIPRDTYASIPAATSFNDVPFDRWRELNIDGLIIGTVQVADNVLTLEVRLLNVRTQQQAFGRRYTGSPADPRLYAHTVSDELHQQQRALRGVARTKLAFVSDRDGDRLAGTIEDRGVKEIYFSDYDGENPRRLTVGRTLNITPAWSPDGRSIAYTSFRRSVPNIFISNIYQGTLEEMTKGPGENYLPSWSPDGKRVCFTSTRNGNAELYVANRDGSNVVRLTNHPAIDISPTWSPSGTQIAFTSDRSGSPQIYVVDADGLGLQKITSESYADRPTWSPPPYNEIAYTARNGRTLDIKVINMATREVRQLTFGEGDNESPAWAPNGRHLAFVSTRAGKKQIFTMAGDGKNVRQITKSGNNSYPDWSK
jgi:TolB protein